MTVQEQLNAMQKRIADIDFQKAASDRAALDFVKSLPAFKEAYPEYSQNYEQAKALESTASSQLTDILAEWELHIGEPVKAGDTVVRNGIQYTVLQDHTLQADWVPGEVPALYQRVEAAGEDGYADWVQPTGGHDAYKAGDKVAYNGKHYESLIDGNVWSPDAYPAGWKEI